MGRLVLYGVGGIVVVATGLKLLMMLLGTVIAVAAFVLLRVVPLILLGWLVLWLWRQWRKEPA